MMEQQFKSYKFFDVLRKKMVSADYKNFFPL